MNQVLSKRLRVWPTVAVVALLAGTVAVALAQGSASRSAGSGTRTPDPEKEKEKIEVKAELNAEALKALMDARVPMVLADARGPSEQWIGGAVPLAHDADKKAVRRALLSRDRVVVTYCGGPQCPMSQKLANRLAEMGYANVIRFTDGIDGWTEAGFDLKEKDKGSGSKKSKSGSSSKPRGSSYR